MQIAKIAKTNAHAGTDKMHETNKQRPNTRLSPEAYIDFPISYIHNELLVIIYSYPIFYVFPGFKWQVHGVIAI